MDKPIRIIPVYKTSGEPGAYLVYPYIFNLEGEWVGWITPAKEIYSIDGQFVGTLTEDPRIFAPKSQYRPRYERTSPPPPKRIKTPISIPLARMMSEVPYGMIDVLMEDPHRLHTIDTGPLKEDMD